jgi:hypothetical protein
MVDKVYFSVYNCARKGALFAPLWKIRFFIFLFAPCTVDISLLWEHILKRPPLDY